MAERNVDNLMNSMGNPGKFQVLVYCFLAGSGYLVLCNHLTMVFYAAKTNHQCRTANGPSLTGNSGKQWQPSGECHLYAKNNTVNTTETIPCTNGWTYYMEDGEATIISEFNLVCDDAYKADLATTIYFCGVTLGGLPFGALADKYGRKPVLGITLFAVGTISMAIFIFRTYVAFVILRFCLGFMLQGLQNSSFVLAMELFAAKHRSYAGVIIGLSANCVNIFFGPLAYLIKDWKYIQLAISVLPFTLLFALFIIPESTRWHLFHGKFSKAEYVVKKTVSFNKLPFPRELFNQIRRDSIKEASYSQRKRRGSVVDIVRSPALRRISFILSIIWFTVSASYFGLAFNISFLFGNKYLNFLISAVTDTSALCVMLWAVPRFGSRRPLALALFLACISNVTCMITNVVSTESNTARLLGTATALFGKACMACTVCVMFLFTSELYPTVVRNVSLGVNTFWSRIGGMAAPQIFFLGVYTSTFVPFAIIGALTLLSSFLMLLLPETHNKALLDSLEHKEILTLYEEDEHDVSVTDNVICETSL